jgi:hypothetical protein
MRRLPVEHRILLYNKFRSLIYFVILGIEFRALHMIGMCPKSFCFLF